MVKFITNATWGDDDVMISASLNTNCGISQMWALLAACRELAEDHNRLPDVLYVFDHKMYYIHYILTDAPYTRIVVFWHTSNIHPRIP